jgi:iron complex transport system ATP-binding protein
MADARSARVVAAGVMYSIGPATLLHGVSLKVQPGEVVVLVGPNGAGKSTLMHILSGDLAPTSGEVVLDGRSLTAYRPHELATRRAVLPQQSLLQFAFTVREVVEMGRAPHDDSPATLRANVDRALERTELTAFAERVYPSLSGGEKSRAQLARVIAQEAPLLLLDEPTAALDLRHQQHVMDLARDIAAEGGSVIAVVHDLNLASTTAHRIAVLHQGQIVADGEPWAVMDAQMLSEVYQCPISVTKHPILDAPLILPLGRANPTRERT